MDLSDTLVCVCVALITFSCLRHIFWKFVSKTRIPCKTFIILGSGGHTRELLEYVSFLNSSLFTPRIYIHSENDPLSRTKAEQMEDSKRAGTIHYETITRAREVGQSWCSSIFSTLKAMVDSAWILFKWAPDLVVCNGPGVCLPICVLARLLSISGVQNVRVVFIESFCRAETLSLTGRLLLHFVDGFIVQWEELAQKYKGTTYLGPVDEHELVKPDLSRY